MTCSKKQIIAVLLLIICSFLLSLLNLLDLTINQVAIISIISFGVSMFFLINNSYKFLSLPVMFLIFTFIFDCGQPVVKMLGYEKVFGYDMLVYTTQEAYIKATILSSQIMLWVTMGSVFVKKRYQNISIEDNYSVDDANLVRSIGEVLLICSLPVRMYVDIMKIISFISSGYAASLVAVESGLLSTIAKFTDIAILLIIIGLRDNRKKAKMVFLLTCAYHMLFIVTGNRGYGIIRIIVLIITYNKFFEIKINKKKLIMLFIGVYLAGGFILTIGETRLVTTTVSSFLDLYFESVISGKVFLQILSVFGVTIETICHSITTFPTHVNYSYGKNLISSLVVILPNVGGFFANIVDKATYITLFPINHNMGGSFIGEIYYAFGPYCLIFAFVIGVTIGKLEERVNQSLCTGRFYSAIVGVICYPCFLWWIRDYFWTLIRDVSWTLIAIYLIYQVLYTIRKRGIR